MSVAEKRAANRRMVAVGKGFHRAPGSMREDGLTGAEVLEIWARTGAIAVKPDQRDRSNKRVGCGE